MKKYPIVIIDWLDSESFRSRWEILDEIDLSRPSKCTAIGFLLERNKEYTMIIQAINEEQTQVLGRITIPSGAILKIKKIKK